MSTMHCARLVEAIHRAVFVKEDGRPRRSRILASVFTTFAFDRAAFADFILPGLYGCPVDGRSAYRMAQLAEQLQFSGSPAVFFDEDASVDDTLDEGSYHQAAFRYDAVPVGIDGGCQHAKHLLLLVADGDDLSTPTRLVVVTTSANLTSAGWRENIEVADIQQLSSDEPSRLASDLSLLGSWLARWAAEAGLQPAEVSSLAAVRAFLDSLPMVVAETPALPRLWVGQSDDGTAEDLVRFVERTRQTLPPAGRALRVSAGAPYISPDAAPLLRLRDAFTPAAFYVMLPMTKAGEVTSPEQWEDAVRSRLGGALRMLRRPDSGREAEVPRFVHAKFLHIAFETSALLVVGSPNLSNRAFAGYPRPESNFETAIVVSSDPGLSLLDTPVDPDGHPRVSLEDEPGKAVRTARPLRLIYDWSALPETTSEVLGTEPPSRRAIVTGLPPGVGFSARISSPLDADRVLPCELAPDRDQHRLLVRDMERIEAWIQRTAVLRMEVANDLRPLLVVERNQHIAPSRVSVHFTRDDLLRSIIMSELGEDDRLARMADRLDLALDHESAGMPSVTSRARTPFDRPVAILQALAALDARICRATDEHGRLVALFGTAGGSLAALVKAFARTDDESTTGPPAESATENAVENLVVWLGATAMLRRHAKDLSHLDLRETRARIDADLAVLAEAWEHVDDAEELRSWMLDEWDYGPPAAARADGVGAGQGAAT